MNKSDSYIEENVIKNFYCEGVKTRAKEYIHSKSVVRDLPYNDKKIALYVTSLKLLEYKTMPVSPLDRFNELANKWKLETGGYSTVSQKVINKNYKAIIELGYPIVKYLLKELEISHEHWYVALSKITKENPVPMADMGNFEKMRMYWIDWGKKENII